MKNNNEQAKQAAPQLLSTELRVLGVLMEKQLTTPDQYPLTLNSVITACNQKSSRDPISNLTQGEVARALQELDNKHFVRKERSSRSEKFTQQFMNHLELGRKQQALLCVMMLRGPQTLSELNTRTQRMCDFADKEDLEHTVERLCTREIPYVMRLSQQPGQRGERFAHLFSGNPARGATATHTEPAAHTSTGSSSDNSTHSALTPEQSVTTTSSTALDVSNKNQDALAQQVETLSNQVDSLREETSVLKQQIKILYELTGHTNSASSPE